jgi:hypothetical protein
MTPSRAHAAAATERQSACPTSTQSDGAFVSLGVFRSIWGGQASHIIGIPCLSIQLDDTVSFLKPKTRVETTARCKCTRRARETGGMESDEWAEHLLAHSLSSNSHNLSQYPSRIAASRSESRSAAHFLRWIGGHRGEHPPALVDFDVWCAVQSCSLQPKVRQRDWVSPSMSIHRSSRRIQSRGHSFLPIDSHRC